MAAKFVERAKAAEPEGVVVLEGDWDSGPGRDSPILEDGDIIVMPAMSDVVPVSGEVMA